MHHDISLIATAFNEAIDMTHDFDPFVDRASIRAATTLSFPTLHRMQKRGEFPPFQRISPGRVGLRQSTLSEFLGGRRNWTDAA